MADQPQQLIVGESSWDDALDKYVDEEILGEKPEPEIDDVDDEETDSEAIEAAPEEDNAEDEPEYVEITHNGKPVKMSLDEVLEHASKGFDYTQKTQQLADQRRQIEMAARNLQEQQQLQQATLQHTAQLYALDSQLANYQQVNWDAWTDQDPIEAQKGWHKYQILKSQRDELAQSINQYQTQYKNQSAAQLQAQLRAGAEELAREIKGWNSELVAALVDNGTRYGFSREEVESVVDPRMVKVLHDAYQWRQLQEKKPEVQKRVTQAPKLAKPGGKVDDTAANQQALLKKLRSAKTSKARQAIASNLLDKYV